jgi:hypothetical protein
MKEPKITFKNVKTFRGMEGIGLNADIYINGVKCIFVIDEANGGEYNYENYEYNNPKAEQVRANIKLMDNYIASLPAKICTDFGKSISIKVDRDTYINDKLLEIEEQKADKKMQKLFKTGIVFGVPNSGKYQYLNFKRPLSEIMSMIVQRQINIVKKEYCKNGEQILNTNLAKLGLIV